MQQKYQIHDPCRMYLALLMYKESFENSGIYKQSYIFTNVYVVLYIFLWSLVVHYVNRQSMFRWVNSLLNDRIQLAPKGTVLFWPQISIDY